MYINTSVSKNDLCKGFMYLISAEIERASICIQCDSLNLVCLIEHSILKSEMPK